MGYQLVEKTLSKENIFKGRIIDVNLHDVVLPNGKKSKREVVNHPGAVAVLAVTDDEKLVLVKQFRKPLDKVIAEIPAGKLEKGEEPKACALRELEEETGYCADHIEEIMSFYTSPGFADEIIYLYLAKGLKDGKKQTDEDEFVELMEVSFSEAMNLIKANIIHDAKTICAIQHWLLNNK
ncbi:NUDIX hydrolase [Alteribacter populi]|uniref:NUDIX hydrolase n=1 Tax=Alteribacter populi TaxID=2011011 RepID=UPI000BBAE82F|nr:NUDIX hydrolase [Alteribacter populi]